MKTLRCTLLSDGSSDAILIPVLSWLLRQHGVEPIAFNRANLSRIPNPPKTLPEKISQALHLYPCELLFVHRDAERENPKTRNDEIQNAARQAQCILPLVPVIPVRMSEAWLLWDAQAIRRAAGNPNGTEPLHLPPMNRLESRPDPKSDLRELLSLACGLTGRRGRNFSWETAIHRIPDHMDNFTPLRGLGAFLTLEKKLKDVITNQGWTSREPASENP